jgi:predicted nucleic acid-binding protein
VVLFADTSALIKLYLDEPHTNAMRQLARDSQVLCVCRVAWAEAFAALAQRVRLKSADTDAAELARRELARHWVSFSVIDVTQPVVERAGDYADTFSLRADDAVQLAAAQELAAHLDDPPAFACFDRRLNRAAQILGMKVPFIESI